jgi:hypothetical protein
MQKNYYKIVESVSKRDYFIHSIAFILELYKSIFTIFVIKK